MIAKLTLVAKVYEQVSNSRQDFLHKLRHSPMSTEAPTNRFSLVGVFHAHIS